MPQMAPLSWTLLPAMFYAVLLMFVAKLYFLTWPSPLPASLPAAQPQKMTWQW